MHRLAREITCLWLAFLFMQPAFSTTLTCANQSPIDKRYFGMHVHRFHDARMIPNVGFGSWRLWDAGVNWSQLQPSRDAWDFRRLELALSIAQRRNVEVGLVLGMTPGWASARPTEHSHASDGAGSEPRDFADWDNYVRTVALRYKGRIQYYEIWNEPDTTAFYTGTVPQMVELARRAHQIIKSIDADAIVVSPSPAKLSSLPWFTQFVKAGGLTYADVVGYHFYTNSKIPEDLIPFVETVRSVLSLQGISKPIWNTESGVVNDGTPNTGLLIGPAAHVGRWLILGACLGLERFNYYAWDNSRLGLFDPERVAVRPQALAYEQIEKWLKGTVVTTCEFNDKWSKCMLHKKGVQYSILWTDTEAIIGDVGTFQNAEDGFGTYLKSPPSSLPLAASPILAW